MFVGLYIYDNYIKDLYLKKILLNSTLLIPILIVLVLLGQKLIIIYGLFPVNSSPEQFANAITTQLISQAIIMILHIMISIIMILAVNSKLLIKSVRILFFSFSIIICINGFLNIAFSVIAFILIFIKEKFFTGTLEQNVQ